MRIFPFALVLGCVFAWRDAAASHLWAVTAYQATRTENSIEVVPVTFMVMGDDFSPGREVNLVCTPCILPMVGTAPEEPQVNRNIAAEARVKAWTVAMSGDTLSVMIDLSEMRRNDPDLADVTVVDATVRAVLRTAAQSCSRSEGSATPAWIDLRIEGPAELSAAGRTYSCEEVQRMR